MLRPGTQLAIALPKDRDVLASYGKALAANGQFDAALDAVRRAQTPEYPDWRLVSAEAAILDQLGQKDDARQLYRKALELKPNPQVSLLESLKNHLRGQQHLLVIDNFEHLIEAAGVVTEVLKVSPGLKALVTSRERLNVYGEQLFPVQPLAVPGDTSPDQSGVSAEEPAEGSDDSTPRQPGSPAG